MATYQYIGKSGEPETIDAYSEKAALDYAAIKGDPHTGVVFGEPTVLSTENAESNFQNNVQPTIDEANGKVEDSQRRAQEQADRKAKEAEDAVPDEVMDDARSDIQKELDEEEDFWEEQLAGARSVFDTSVAYANQVAQSQIQRIDQVWRQRQSEMQKANREGLREQENIFVRLGISRYTPGRAVDILTESERRGIERVAELDSIYLDKIANVNSALAENKFSLASELAGDIREIELESRNALKDIEKEAKEKNK